MAGTLVVLHRPSRSGLEFQLARLRSRPSRCDESSGGGWMHNLGGAGQERGRC